VGLGLGLGLLAVAIDVDAFEALGRRLLVCLSTLLYGSMMPIVIRLV
jgi:hypothetical protein